MKNRIQKTVFLIVFSFLAVSWLDPYRDEVTKGNGKYHDKKYDDAAKHYRDAEKYAPDESEKKKLKFNKGNIDYMTEDYKSAIYDYTQALRSGERNVQKKAFFNMGNTYMRMKKYKEAVDSFISALKIDPNYERAKKNLEYLLKKKRDDNKKKNKDNKDKNKGGNEDKEKKRDEKDDKKSDKKRDGKKGKMNREQLRNILETMKNKPVRRKKGEGDGRRFLRKFW